MKRTIPDSRISFLVSRATSQISEDEHEGVFRELAETSNRLLDRTFTDGFQAPPLFELFLRERAMIYTEKAWLNESVRYALAMQRDITSLLHAQISERRKYGGNVVLEFAGFTGAGKSSCMLGLMERHNKLGEHVQREGVDAIRARLAIDIADIPHKLERLESGDAIALDEQLDLVGENARTHLSVLRNLEDTLRGTMIDIHFASPGTREGHDTSQGILEAISVSPPTLRHGQPGRKMTKFLYSIGLNGHPPIPLGVVNLPWCGEETFRAYSVIKNENLARTKRLQFHAGGEVHEATIKRLFDNPGLVARLRIKGRPSKADWKRYIKRYGPSMSIAEVDTLASEIEEMFTCLRDEPQQFAPIWGYEPPLLMKQIALDLPTDARDGGQIRDL